MYIYAYDKLFEGIEIMAAEKMWFKSYRVYPPEITD